MANQTGAENTPTAKERAERVDARLKIATAVLGLLTAVFALLAGVFVKKTDTASTKVDTTEDQVRVLASRNAALEADNLQKDARLKQLEAGQAAAAANGNSSSSASPATTGADTPAVFHKGPLTLKNSVTADLDATPDLTQWNINGSGWDISLSPLLLPEGLNIANGALALVVRDDASYSTCKNSTGYSTEPISINALKKTKTLCVITGEGRYSTLSIKEASDAAVSFDVNTYSKESD